MATTATPSPGVAWRRVLIGLFIALLAVEGWLFAPYIGRAFARLPDADGGWLAVAIALELLSVRAFAGTQQQILRAGDLKVGARRMTALTYASTALSLSLPGGAAVSSAYAFRQLRAWGATVAAAGFAITASGVLSAASFAALAGAAGAVAGGIGTTALLALGLLVLFAGFVLLLRRVPPVRLAGGLLSRVNRLRHAPPEAGLGLVTSFLADLRTIHLRRWAWLGAFGTALLNWTLDLACLVACCRAVGIDHVPLATVLLAYVAGMSAASLSPLPGGAGLADAALIVVLAGGGPGTGTAVATAAVLTYRLINLVMVVGVGWLALAGFRLARSARCVTRSAARRSSWGQALEFVEAETRPAGQLGDVNRAAAHAAQQVAGERSGSGRLVQDAGVGAVEVGP